MEVDKVMDKVADIVADKEGYLCFIIFTCPLNAVDKISISSYAVVVVSGKHQL